MRRLTAVLTVTVIAASGLLAGCGGGDEQSEKATTTAGAAGSGSEQNGAEQSGAEQSGGSGSASEFCSLSNQLDTLTNNPGSATADNPEFIAVTERVKAGAPDEIKDSVTLILDTYTTKGFSAEVLQDPKLAQASKEIAAWLGKNCSGSADDGDGKSNDGDRDDN